MLMEKHIKLDALGFTSVHQEFLDPTTNTAISLSARCHIDDKAVELTITTMTRTTLPYGLLAVLDEHPC